MTNLPAEICPDWVSIPEETPEQTVPVNVRGLRTGCGSAGRFAPLPLV